MTDLQRPPWKAWLATAAVFVAAAFLWRCSLGFTPQPFQHPHAAEAEHTREKYE